MAADEPAKAPPLYEPLGWKSTACPARLAGWHSHANVRSMKRALPLVVLLAACSQQPGSPAANKGDEPPPAAKPAVPAPTAFVFDERNHLIDYHFGWSAEAAAVPQLVQRFRAEMDKDKAELLANAKQDKAYRDKEGYPFNGYTSSTDVTTAGQSARLLSLSVDVGAYTGGAHGNSGTSGLLWHRQAAKESPSRICSPRPPTWTGCSPSAGATH